MSEIASAANSNAYLLPNKSGYIVLVGRSGIHTPKRRLRLTIRWVGAGLRRVRLLALTFDERQDARSRPYSLAAFLVSWCVGSNPLVATAGTPDAATAIVATELRSGNASSASGRRCVVSGHDESSSPPERSP
jgi:hypothetical protein